MQSLNSMHESIEWKMKLWSTMAAANTYNVKWSTLPKYNSSSVMTWWKHDKKLPPSRLKLNRYMVLRNGFSLRLPNTVQKMSNYRLNTRKCITSAPLPIAMLPKPNKVNNKHNANCNEFSVNCKTQMIVMQLCKRHCNKNKILLHVVKKKTAPT